MRSHKGRAHPIVTGADKTHAPRKTPRGAGKPDARDPDKQDRLTPPDFLDAVERRFGPLVFDLAAEHGKSVRGLPCFTKEDDALTRDWVNGCFPERREFLGNRWLNPPFEAFAKFAEKSAAEATHRCPVLMLHLASVDSNWFWEHVAPHALSWAIDRVQFVGETHPFPKPLMLSLFGLGGGNGHIQRWRWRERGR